MICAAVFETDERVRELLREWMVEYLIQENRELNLLWFTQDVTEEKLEKYAKKISFAVISLDREEGRKAGELLYRLNPECRIAYYRCASCALEPLLPTRPSAFFLRKDEKGKEELQKVLGRGAAKGPGADPGGAFRRGGSLFLRGEEGDVLHPPRPYPVPAERPEIRGGPHGFRGGASALLPALAAGAPAGRPLCADP